MQCTYAHARSWVLFSAVVSDHRGRQQQQQQMAVADAKASTKL